MWEPLCLELLCCFSGASSDIFLLSNSNTESLPLLFHSHCSVWSCAFLFMTNPLPVGPHLLFLYLCPLYSRATLPPASATSFSFVVLSFLFLSVCPCFSSLMSSLLQRSPSHLRWHHSHHAVAVPRRTTGWIWFPAVQKLHVSRVCSVSSLHCLTCSLQCLRNIRSQHKHYLNMQSSIFRNDLICKVWPVLWIVVLQECNQRLCWYHAKHNLSIAKNSCTQHLFRWAFKCKKKTLTI